MVRKYLPWFTVWHLFGFMVLFIIVMMIFFYKIIIPSIVAFGVQQTYKHRNPMVTDLQSILKNQEAILGEMRNIENRLARLEGGKS